MNPLEAEHSPDLFGSLRKDNVTYAAWDCVTESIYGLPITDMKLFKQLTGRTKQPNRKFRRALIVCGRRSGKSHYSAKLAVYTAAFHDFSDYLTAGEVGVVMLFAVSKAQAKVLMRYIKGILHAIPLLEQLIEKETEESIDLTNGISIEVHSNNFKSSRGRSTVCNILDEAAYYSSEFSASPDYELYNALLPSMVTIPDSLMLVIGSPYAKHGLMFDLYNDNYAQNDSETLVIQAPTILMNPTVPQDFIDSEYERDPISASAEYGAQFRSDRDTFISSDAVDACVMENVFKINYDDCYQHFIFVDPSSGAGKDSYTLAVVRIENNIPVLCCVVEITPPYSPSKATDELAEICREYHVSSVTGDAYAGSYPRELFEKQGIAYQVSKLNRSEIYLELLGLIMSGSIKLLQHKKMIVQLLSLERRVSRSGKDSIDARLNGHEDIINSSAGALVLAHQQINTGDSICELFGNTLSSEYVF